MPVKVLFADDNITAQNMGKKILAEAGYEVIAVSNGAAALKKFASERPDVLVLDIFMPGYSGLEVCQKIKADRPVPVLLTVGKLEPYRNADGARVKADGVIVKPFEATELVAAVKKLADAAKATSASRSSNQEPEPEMLQVFTPRTPAEKPTPANPEKPAASAENPAAHYEEFALAVAAPARTGGIDGSDASFEHPPLAGRREEAIVSLGQRTPFFASSVAEAIPAGPTLVTTRTAPRSQFGGANVSLAELELVPASAKLAEKAAVVADDAEKQDREQSVTKLDDNAATDPDNATTHATTNDATTGTTNGTKKESWWIAEPMGASGVAVEASAPAEAVAPLPDLAPFGQGAEVFPGVLPASLPALAELPAHSAAELPGPFPGTDTQPAAPIDRIFENACGNAAISGVTASDDRIGALGNGLAGSESEHFAAPGPGLSSPAGLPAITAGADAPNLAELMPRSAHGSEPGLELVEIAPGSENSTPASALESAVNHATEYDAAAGIADLTPLAPAEAAGNAEDTGIAYLPTLPLAQFHSELAGLGSPFPGLEPLVETERSTPAPKEEVAASAPNWRAEGFREADAHESQAARAESDLEISVESVRASDESFQISNRDPLAPAITVSSSELSSSPFETAGVNVGEAEQHVTEFVAAEVSDAIEPTIADDLGQKSDAAGELNSPEAAESGLIVTTEESATDDIAQKVNAAVDEAGAAAASAAAPFSVSASAVEQALNKAMARLRDNLLQEVLRELNPQK